MNLPLLADLFLTFMKIGLFTFGGGYAMISFIEDDCVEKKAWISYDEMMTITVIAESTPGPIAINCATYIGFKKQGLIGSAVATLGLVLPSFAVIFLISLFFDRFLEFTLFANALKGVKAAVGILIVDAGLKMRKKMPKRTQSRLILGLSLTAMLYGNLSASRLSSIALMLAAAVFSLALYLIRGQDRDGQAPAECGPQSRKGGPDDLS